MSNEHEKQNPAGATAPSAAPVGVPAVDRNAVLDGWQIGNASNGRIVVRKEGLVGYIAERDSDSIASSILYELACSLRYAAAPVAQTDESQWIDRLTYDAQVDEWAIERSNLESEIERLSAPVAQPSAQTTVPEGPWVVRAKHYPDGTIKDCFVEGPREGDMAYALEVLGDDYEGYGGMERKLEHCNLIVSCVNARLAAPSQEPSAQVRDASVPTWQERMQNYYSRGDVKIRPYEAFMLEELDDYRTLAAAQLHAQGTVTALNAARYEWLRYGDLAALAAANWGDGEVYTGERFDAAVDAMRLAAPAQQPTDSAAQSGEVAK